MLKRILSVFLVLTMLLSMGVTALAATATTAEPYNLVMWDGTLITATDGTTSTEAVNTGTLYPADGRIAVNTSGAKRFGITVISKGTGTGVSSVVSSTGDKYYSVNYSKDLRYDPSTNINLYAQVTSTSTKKPVFSVMYDIMIPNDANANAERTFTPSFTTENGKNGVLGSSADYTDYGEFVIKYADGEFAVDSLVGIDATTVVTDTANYTPGNWVTVEVRAYYDATTIKLTYGVYVGDKQIMYGVGTTLYPSMIYLDRALWHQPSIATNYDNICMRTLSVEDKPVTFTAETPEPEEPAGPVVTDLNVNDFDDLTTTATTNTLTVASESLLSSPKNLTHSSTTNRSTEYVGEAREDNGMALVVTTSTTTLDETNSSKNTVMVHQPKRHFAGYVEEDGKEYIISSSYEIYVPEASKESERMHTFTFSGVNNTDADCMLASYIKDGKLNFGLDILTENTKLTDFTERAKTAELPSDVWNKITYIMKIKYDTTNAQYDINLYGIYADECYYECSFKLDLSYANGLCMLIQGLTITGLDDKAVVTKYDNIKISSYSAMPEITYAWTDAENYIYPLALNSTGSSVEAKAKVLGSYANLCLVTAVYDADDKLVKLWTDTTLEDGYLSYTVTGSDYIKSEYEVKAFLFDSITTAIPYVENVGLVIE